jgi:hypothetical protein
MADTDRRQDGKMQVDQSTLEGASDSTRAEPGIPDELRGAIGKQLRQVYSQMLSEPLPDKFTQLLDSLGKTRNEK